MQQQIRRRGGKGLERARKTRKERERDTCKETRVRTERRMPQVRRKESEKDEICKGRQRGMRQLRREREARYQHDGLLLPLQWYMKRHVKLTKFFDKQY